MIEGPITFDRIARWGLVTGGFVVAFIILDYLSAVLLPFFVAWLFAYLLYPLVKFIQYRMKVRIRAVSIVLAMIACITVLGGVLWLIIPPMIEQFGKFTTLATRYLHHATHISSFPEAIQWWLNENSTEIEKYLRSDNFS